VIIIIIIMVRGRIAHDRKNIKNIAHNIPAQDGRNVGMER